MKKYNNLDGLRAFAAVGIICMHVRANIGYEICVEWGGINYLINIIIAQFAELVRLFFVISGFAMCCGYYEKIKEQRISLNEFYNKRYF